jgi:hypothetical protein
MQRCIRFIGQNLAYKSYEVFQVIKKIAAFGTLLSRSEQSPKVYDKEKYFGKNGKSGHFFSFLAWDIGD